VPTSVRVRVPAKINLSLAVGPPRADGFHNLATVFQAISLFDEVTVTRKSAIGGALVDLSGSEVAGVPATESNLAWRAVAALANRLGRDPDVSIAIKKAIPVAGGMAGGSADAAAALVGCARLWEEGTREQIQATAAEIGSDVPFALMGGTAVGVGRGEILTPAMVRGTYEWVFALAEQGLSTPTVYRRCDELRGPGFEEQPRVDDVVMMALRSGDSVALGRAISNDLQPAAISLAPHLQSLLDLGLEQGALGGIVSGSGPTCGFLVGSSEEALDVAVALSASGLCSAVRRAEGPVDGAAVVGVT
jgi:4-diphosphocytidyl-2-C-methyl-D-erythritol kinase